MQLQTDRVARIWADVIGIPDADIHTNFFDLGGHSLLLIDLVSRLNQELHTDADVLNLMEYPTVATFTAHWNDATAHWNDAAAHRNEQP